MSPEAVARRLALVEERAQAAWGSGWPLLSPRQRNDARYRELVFLLHGQETLRAEFARALLDAVVAAAEHEP